MDLTMDMSGEPDDIASRTSTLRRGQGDAEAALSVAELFRVHHLELVRPAVVMVGDLGFPSPSNSGISGQQAIAW